MYVTVIQEGIEFTYLCSKVVFVDRELPFDCVASEYLVELYSYNMPDKYLLFPLKDIVSIKDSLFS